MLAEIGAVLFLYPRQPASFNHSLKCQCSSNELTILSPFSEFAVYIVYDAYRKTGANRKRTCDEYCSLSEILKNIFHV